MRTTRSSSAGELRVIAMAGAMAMVALLVAHLGALGCAPAPVAPAPHSDGAATITGTVVDASDTSRAIADVWLYMPTTTSSSRAAYLRDATIAEDRSGADGGYALGGVPAGRQRIVVEPPVGSNYAFTTVDIEVADGASITLRITLVQKTLADQIASVTVAPPAVTLPPNAIQQFTATAADASGANLHLAPVWAVTNTVGTIEQDGEFTAGTELKQGRVYAFVADHSGAANVTVAASGNDAPHVSLEMAPAGGLAPLDVTATVRASDPDGTVRSLAIDWGDGGTTTPNTVGPLLTLPHTYSSSGEFVVAATATDDQGATAQATATVVVANGPPTCSIAATPTSGLAPLQVAFTVSGSDPEGPIALWQIDFGDGGTYGPTATEPDTVIHTYLAVGTFVARLTVTDSDGASGTDTATVTVSAPENQPPTATLTVEPATGVAPLSVTITGSGSDPDGSLVRYELDFEGDGAWEYDSPDAPASVAHEYAVAGIYAPVLRVTDDQGATGSDSVTVTVTQAPVLSVSPTALTFGRTLTVLTINISNIGGGNLDWTVSETETWITALTPSSGTNAGTISVTVDRAGLQDGLHAGSISVSSNGGAETVAVTILAGPPSGRIGFTSDRDGHWDIFVIDADGSDLANLTNSAEGAGGPAWSPDGQKVAFVRGDPSEIYVMNADGSSPVNLTNHPERDTDPRWSADGSRISFRSTRGDPGSDVYNIYVMNSDGSDPIQVTHDSASISGYQWSPDSTKFAFHSAREGNTRIYVISVDGSGEIIVTNSPDSGAWVTWSPDSSRIAFHSEQAGNWEIYAVDADGSNMTKLTDNPGTMGNGTPTWSPDGGKILFESFRDGNFEVYSMNPDGSGQVNLTNNAAADRMGAWSPDSARIAFKTDRDAGVVRICVAEADGSGAATITDAPNLEAAPVWLP